METYKKCLTEKQLTTNLVEVEAIVNSRPLVYVDDDIKSSHVLTPSNFVMTNPTTSFLAADVTIRMWTMRKLQVGQRQKGS